MSKWKADMSDHFGILCMSENYHHPLMWSHYAEKHQGLCLGFDVNEQFIKQIKYLPKRLSKTQIGLQRLNFLDENQMKEILYTKYRAWSYEKEWRLIANFENAPNPKKLEFVEFSSDLKLTEVIVGAASNLSRADVQKALGKLKNVATFKVRPAFKTFHVVKNKNERLWT